MTPITGVAREHLIASSPSAARRILCSGPRGRQPAPAAFIPISQPAIPPAVAAVPRDQQHPADVEPVLGREHPGGDQHRLARTGHPTQLAAAAAARPT